MTETKVTYTKKSTVCCDGNGDGAEGHPKVYLCINAEDGFVICPYCSRKFTAKKESIAQYIAE